MRLAPSGGSADVEPCVATFTQWNKNRPLRRVTWVCGPEHVLVHAVREEFRKLQVPHYGYYTDVVTDEPLMWDSILTWPRGGSLAVVYGAERLKNLDRVTTVVETIPELARVLFISAEADFARVEDGEKKVLAPHLSAIQESKEGQLIRCCKPSREEDMLKLVASWWPGAGLNLAAEVMARTGGVLETAYAACKTAELAGLPASPDYLDMAVQQTPSAKFAEHLVAGKRKEAATEASQLGEAAIGGTLKYLSGLLDSLRLYHAMSASGMDAEQIVRKGIPRWQQKHIAPYAASYSAQRVVRCRRVLAVAESAFRSGIRDGVLEAVAALW